MTKCETILESGLTAKGTDYLSVPEIEACLDFIWARRAFIHSMEAFEITKDYDTANVELSIYGLDGKENWENHQDVERAQKLVREKLELAKQSSHEIRFNIWLDWWPAGAIN